MATQVDLEELQSAMTAAGLEAKEYIVEWDFSGETQDELSLVEGERVKVFLQEDGGWWLGSIADRVGWFPSNIIYCEEDCPLEDYDGESIHENSESFNGGEISQESWPVWNDSMVDDFTTTADDFGSEMSNFLVDSMGNSSSCQPGLPNTAGSVDSLVTETLNLKLGGDEPQERPQVGEEEPPPGTSAIESKLWYMPEGKKLEESMSAVDIKRQKAIFETILTEKEYVERDLTIIIDLFMKPLLKQKIISPATAAVLFSNIEQLVPVNTELMRQLCSRKEANTVVERVGDIFLAVADYMKMYTLYCGGFPSAMVLFEKEKNRNKSFKAYVDDLQAKPVCALIDLGGFLLKPVQRICKYPLLIREILRHTPEDHSDHASLEAAIVKIESVVTVVNEASRSIENAQKMIDLQKRLKNSANEHVELVTPSRRFIREQSAIEVFTGSKKKGEERLIILFTDGIILARVDKKGILRLCDDNVGGSAIAVFDLVIVNDLEDERSFELINLGAKTFHSLQLPSVTSKVTWMEDLVDFTGDGLDVKHQMLQHLLEESGAQARMEAEVAQLKADKEAEKEAAAAASGLLTRVGSSKRAGNVKDLEGPKKPLPPLPPGSNEADDTISLGSEAADAYKKASEEKYAAISRDPLHLLKERRSTQLRNSVHLGSTPSSDLRASLANFGDSAPSYCKAYEDQAKKDLTNTVRVVGWSKREDLYVYLVDSKLADKRFEVSFQDFHNLHVSLISYFPEEAGVFGGERQLPDLPDQIPFMNDTLAARRMRELERYCRRLFQLSDKITQSVAVVSFFSGKGEKKSNTLPTKVTPRNRGRGLAGREKNGTKSAVVSSTTKPSNTLAKASINKSLPKGQKPPRPPPPQRPPETFKFLRNKTGNFNSDWVCERQRSIRSRKSSLANAQNPSHAGNVTAPRARDSAALKEVQGKQKPQASNTRSSSGKVSPVANTEERVQSMGMKIKMNDSPKLGKKVSSMAISKSDSPKAGRKVISMASPSSDSKTAQHVASPTSKNVASDRRVISMAPPSSDSKTTQQVPSKNVTRTSSTKSMGNTSNPNNEVVKKRNNSKTRFEEKRNSYSGAGKKADISKRPKSVIHAPSINTGNKKTHTQKVTALSTQERMSWSPNSGTKGDSANDAEIPEFLRVKLKNVSGNDTDGSEDSNSSLSKMKQKEACIIS